VGSRKIEGIKMLESSIIEDVPLLEQGTPSCAAYADNGQHGSTGKNPRQKESGIEDMSRCLAL
jgi:hypothetical protein